jgi:adenylosuccinate synthase
MQKGKFNILVDAAWGSSGKGAVAARLADIYRPTDLSASNFPNAGHTVEIVGRRVVFKVLPSAAALILRDIHYAPRLWIGPNSGFWLDDFVKEQSVLLYPKNRVHVHARSIIMDCRHRDAEAPHGELSVEHISSTMSGAGAAFSEKAMRRPEVQTAARAGIADMLFQARFDERLASGKTVLHEVSQGYALSINHGTHYPYCTFRDCTPQQAIADFLVKPHQVGDVYLNVRTFPIRVGNNFRDGKQTGYSGDFYPDQQEVNWEEVGAMAEMPAEEIAALAERERTTVTRKVRRVATQSFQLCREAAFRCGATKIVLNFPQYIHWSAHKLRGGPEMRQKLHPLVRAHIDRLEDCTGLPVVMLGTGAEHEDYIVLE